jgi:hypothetical protein
VSIGCPAESRRFELRLFLTSCRFWSMTCRFFSQVAVPDDGGAEFGCRPGESRWFDADVIVDRDFIRLQQETSDVVLGDDVLFAADRAGRGSSRTLLAASGRIKLLARLEHAFEGGAARLALGRQATPRLSASAVAPVTLLAVSSVSGLRTFSVDLVLTTPPG